MGLLDGTTQSAYYQGGGEKGGYQFTSLEDIVNYFMVVYVGEGKTVSKVNRTDVAFHAQRAMQELSFDTFKSVKSQEIVLPPSNTMMLPHDYVNYTKLSWSDGAGMKHPLYPTSNTSNPFKIEQNSDGSYDFKALTASVVTNGDFSDDGDPLEGWTISPTPRSPDVENIAVTGGALTFTHGSKFLNVGITSRAYSAYQVIDVTDMDYINISAKGSSAAAVGGVKDAGIVRVGFTTLNPSAPLNALLGSNQTVWNSSTTNPNAVSGPGGGWGGVAIPNPSALNHTTDLFNLTTTSGDSAYIEFNDGLGVATTSTLEDVNVIGLTSIWLVTTSYIPNYAVAWTSGNANESINTIDDIEVIYDGQVDNLQTTGNSTTWNNYKSHTPNDNVDKYDDGTYDLARGERYGIDPQHAQVNGSYYVDNLRGLINFSSNVSGKTVILDYISDSLGTDGEMQVHKFAEEAMYKWIMYAVLSTRASIPEYIVRRYQKEKFAATRTAKLRLSNIKLEELTQILRGKSKWIKH